MHAHLHSFFHPYIYSRMCAYEHTHTHTLVCMYMSIHIPILSYVCIWAYTYVHPEWQHGLDHAHLLSQIKDIENVCFIFTHQYIHAHSESQHGFARSPQERSYRQQSMFDHSIGSSKKRRWSEWEGSGKSLTRECIIYIYIYTLYIIDVVTLYIIDVYIIHHRCIHDTS